MLGLREVTHLQVSSDPWLWRCENEPYTHRKVSYSIPHTTPRPSLVTTVWSSWLLKSDLNHVELDLEIPEVKGSRRREPSWILCPGGRCPVGGPRRFPVHKGGIRAYTEQERRGCESHWTLIKLPTLLGDRPCGKNHTEIPTDTWHIYIHCTLGRVFPILSGSVDRWGLISLCTRGFHGVLPSCTCVVKFEDVWLYCR